MDLTFTQRAKEDRSYWDKSGDLVIKKRIKALLQALVANPYGGTGKPEPLKYELSGCWSRRINREHRIIYKVTDH